MKTIFAIVIFLLLGWYLPFWSHTVSAYEKTHIRNAVGYIEIFRSKNSRLPSEKEFQAWKDQEDLRGSGYDGRGFYFREGCYPVKAIMRFGVGGSQPYCLDYWTGDVWVTYWSLQKTEDVVVIDDYGGIVVLLILSGVIISVVMRKKRLRNKRAGDFVI